MTLIVLVTSAFIAAWAHAMARVAHDRPCRLVAETIAITFLALAIGAGIQFTFKG